MPLDEGSRYACVLSVPKREEKRSLGIDRLYGGGAIEAWGVADPGGPVEFKVADALAGPASVGSEASRLLEASGSSNLLLAAAAAAFLAAFIFDNSLRARALAVS